MPFVFFRILAPFWLTIICVLLSLLSKMFILNLVDCVPILLTYGEQGVRIPRPPQGGPYSARVMGDASRIRKSSNGSYIIISSPVLDFPTL